MQPNLSKITSILASFLQKKNKNDEQNFTDKEIEEAFYGIDESCDSIINNKPKTDFKK